jgi:hypothetical protein
VNRNALCLVEPDPGRFDQARAAARRALAVEALLQGAIQISPEQSEELAERLKAAEGELRSVLGQAYSRVQVPTAVTDEGVRFTSRELATVLAAGRGLHERVREALDTHVAAKLYPSKVAALAELGPEREWRWVDEIAHALAAFLDAPKVWFPAALAEGISDGVAQGAFGFAATATEGAAGELSLSSLSSVRLREPLAADLVELGAGAVLMNVSLAESMSAPAGPPIPAPPPTVDQPPEAPVATVSGTEVNGLRLEIKATEDDLFVLSQSLSKLRDLLGGGPMKLTLAVDARAADGTRLDRVRTRNTVIEPLEEDPDVDLRVEWVDGEEPSRD